MTTFNDLPDFAAPAWTVYSGNGFSDPVFSSGALVAAYNASGGGYAGAGNATPYDGSAAGASLGAFTVSMPAAPEQIAYRITTQLTDGRKLRLRVKCQDSSGGLFQALSMGFDTDANEIIVYSPRMTACRIRSTTAGAVPEYYDGSVWHTGTELVCSASLKAAVTTQTEAAGAYLTPQNGGTITATVLRAAATITSVVIAPANTTAAAGTTVAYTGTATLSDGTTRPVTSGDGQFSCSIGAFGGAFGVWTAPNAPATGTTTFVVPANSNTGQTLVTATTPVTVAGTRISNTAVGRVARTLVTMGRRDLRARFSERPVVRALLGPLNNAVIPVPPTPPASGRVLARSVTD